MPSVMRNRLGLGGVVTTVGCSSVVSRAQALARWVGFVSWSDRTWKPSPWIHPDRGWAVATERHWRARKLRPFGMELVIDKWV